MNNKILVLATFISGCPFMDAVRPQLRKATGFVEPSHPSLLKIRTLVNAGSFSEAINQLKDFKAKSGLEEYWKDYLLGTANFAADRPDGGIEALKECYEKFKKDTDASEDHFRIAGLCLKKIGWYYRSQKDYVQAFSYHSIRYNYVLQHGSSLEVHDALISLDVDAYYLGDLHLSEQLLSESIAYGEQVLDEEAKRAALGTSYNNLAGTLYGLEKFDSSLEAINASVKNWEKYEALAGTKEMKLVWAYYAVGDVNENWAKHLKENDLDFLSKQNAALEAFSKSLQLAEERSMKDERRKHIQDRIASIKEL